MNNQNILIVDDEASIRKILEGALKDEGYLVHCAATGEDALKVAAKVKPDLVLLDIWMPGIDGIETLKLLREQDDQIKVVMISGHATIATAISATKIGAIDFLEKPIDLTVLLATIRRGLGEYDNDGSNLKIKPSLTEKSDLSFSNRISYEFNRLVFSDQKLKGRKLKQKTLKDSAVLYGQGLHSGRKSGLILEPLGANCGIHFIGISTDMAVPAHVDYVGSTGFATTINLAGTKAGTIEHLMSALHAFGISNLLIKCNGEVPVLDGSSKLFCSLIREVGILEQDADWYTIKVPQTIRVGDDKEFIVMEPAEEFSINYQLHYPSPVGSQCFDFRLSNSALYESEIAPARTFGFVRDIGALQAQGLALGGRFDNFVLYGNDGVINGSSRFPDEAVRHKVLDAIGDLYLLGRPIDARITASMTGHSDNIALLRELRKLMN